MSIWHANIRKPVLQLASKPVLRIWSKTLYKSKTSKFKKNFKNSTKNIYIYSNFLYKPIVGSESGKIVRIRIRNTSLSDSEGLWMQGEDIGPGV